MAGWLICSGKVFKLWSYTQLEFEINFKKGVMEMFIRILSFVAVFIMSFVVLGRFVYSDEGVVIKRSVDANDVVEMNRRGIDFANKAILKADIYPCIKSDMKRLSEEIKSLKVREKGLVLKIRKFKIYLIKEKAKNLSNPRAREEVIKKYMHQLELLERELENVRRRIPEKGMELKEARVEAGIIKVMRSDPEGEEASERLDRELEAEIINRFNIGLSLLGYK